MVILPGTQEYSIKANWKLLVENSIDGYHAMSTHATYMDYLITAMRKAAEATGEKLAAPDLSLSTPLGHDDGSNRTFYDVIPEDKSLPDEQVESAQFRTLLREKLERFAENLTGRDKVIYDKRLMADPPLTLKEIGDSYGVSRERARQLEKRLLGKLREYLKQEMGDAVEIAMGWET